jgi:uncharacterized protein YqgC (DUF456 family)
MEPVEVGAALGALLGLVVAEIVNKRDTVRAACVGAGLLAGMAFCGFRTPVRLCARERRVWRWVSSR